MAINFNNLDKTQTHKANTEVNTQINKAVANNSVNAQQPKNVAKDLVSITPQARQLSETQRKNSDEPVMNQTKIEELKKAISSGEYRIDPEKLAANIAEFEFSLD